MQESYTYQQAMNEVREILSPPTAEIVQDNISHFAGVFDSTLNQIGNRPKAIEILGWDFFNEHVGGFRENEFSILCGPTGAGKTSLLANLAVKLLLNKTSVFVASVEIGSEDFMKKMISIVTERDFDTIKSRKEVEQTVGKMFEEVNSVFSNYETRINHVQLLCDIYYSWKTKGVKMALVDNLNFLMDVAESKNMIVDMDRAIHDFVVFCKKVPIHVIMVMHPKKTENGRIESEFDIKGSSTAVQEASNVFLFNRVKDSQDAPMGVSHNLCREIKLAKVRKRGRSVGAKLYYAIGERGEGYTELMR